MIQSSHVICSWSVQGHNLLQTSCWASLPESDLKHAVHGQLKGVVRAADFAPRSLDENSPPKQASSPISEQQENAIQPGEQQLGLQQMGNVSQHRNALSPLDNRVSVCSYFGIVSRP